MTDGYIIFKKTKNVVTDGYIIYKKTKNALPSLMSLFDCVGNVCDPNSDKGLCPLASLSVIVVETNVQVN